MKEKINYQDELNFYRSKTQVQNKIIKFFGLALFVSVATSSGLGVFTWFTASVKKERLVILRTDPGRRLTTVENGSMISDAHIKDQALYIVEELIENRNYLNLESKLATIKTHYATEGYKNYLEAYIDQTDYVKTFKRYKYTTTFELDKKRSTYSYCTASQVGCAVITGIRHTFIGKALVSRKAVSHLLFLQFKLPDLELLNKLREEGYQDIPYYQPFLIQRHTISEKDMPITGQAMITNSFDPSEGQMNVLKQAKKSIEGSL